VKAVAARIEADHGRLDLLINNAWAGYERLNAGAWDERERAAVAAAARAIRRDVQRRGAGPLRRDSGIAIAALAGDPEVVGLTGRALGVEALAARYGIDVSS